MGKIFYIIGKSSTGKDTIYRELIGKEELGLKPFVIYTTRPIRAGEKEGKEYYFTDEAGLDRIRKEGRLIELRSYNTVHGIWNYFTADNEHVDLEHESYLMLGVLASYVGVRDYYGAEKVVPIYIEVEDGIRLERALGRERMQEKPKYAELCRRFLADTEDFSEEKIEKAGIERRFVNDELAATVEEITAYIKETR